MLRPPIYFGRSTSSDNLPDSTWVAISLDTDITKSDAGIHSTASNQTRVIATHPGMWEFVGGVSFFTPTLGNVGRHISGLRKNGTTFIRGRTDAAGIDGSTSVVYNGNHWFVDMAINDYVELMAWQETGTAQTTWTADSTTYPYLIARWRSK